MNYYVVINHPYRIGETVFIVPTGKLENKGRVLEAEGLVITPKAGINRVWFRKEDIHKEDLLPF